MTPTARRRGRTWCARCIDALLWTSTGAAGIVLGSQVLGWDGNGLLASAQAVTPLLVFALVPVTLGALLVRRHAAGIAASLLGVAGLALLAPLVFVADEPGAVADASGLEVAAVNLLYTNPDVLAVADTLHDRNADVLVFTEYTAAHHAALSNSSLADSYPYRLARPGPGAEGVALWSRYRFDQRTGPPTVNNNADVVIEGPDGPVRVLGVHTPTPVYDFDEWVDDLDTIAVAASTAPSIPMLLLGDFNASYWHPGFRAIVDRGFSDAHVAAGRGFSTSWPADGIVPAFVRLDHALTGHGLVSTDVNDFDVPGSDHIGFEVTVAPARRAAPGTLARGG